VPQPEPCPDCGGIGNHKRTCRRRCITGKRYYADRAGALAALIDAKLARFRGEHGWGDRRETRTYECPKCHGWHLTSQPKASEGTT
jgi:hypothetical protein